LVRGEHALAIRARNGELRAKQKLVRHNLAFVVAIARKQRRGTVRLDDVIQEGNVGLMRAVEKFDPHGRYALLHVRGLVDPRVHREVPEGGAVDGAPEERDRRAAGSVARQPDQRGGGRHPPRPDRGRRAGPEDAYLLTEGDREVRDALGKVRKRIGELAWDIVHNRLQQDHPRTLEEIGKRWGVSRERIRQVELQTKQFLHRYLEPVERDAA